MSPWLALQQGDQPLQVCRWEARGNQEDLRDLSKQGNWREVPLRVVPQHARTVQRWADRLRCHCGYEQCVSVRYGMGDRLRRDRTCRPGLVLDEDWPAKCQSHRLCDEPGDD